MKQVQGVRWLPCGHGTRIWSAEWSHSEGKGQIWNYSSHMWDLKTLSKEITNGQMLQNLWLFLWTELNSGWTRVWGKSWGYWWKEMDTLGSVVLEHLCMKPLLTIFRNLKIWNSNICFYYSKKIFFSYWLSCMSSPCFSFPC